MTAPRDDPPHSPPAFPSVGGSPIAGHEGHESALPFSPADEVVLAPVATTGARSPNDRWRWVAAGLATILVVALIGGVFLALRPQAGTPSLVAMYAPGDAAAYLEGRLDMPGDQRDKLATFMGRFPGFADPASFQQKIDESLEQALASSQTGLSWTNDIDPWFGGQVGYWMSTINPAPGTPPAFTVAFSVEDRPLLDQLLATKINGSDMQHEEYKGFTIWTGNATDEARRLSLVVTDDAFLISGRNEDLKRSLDVKANEVSGLADDEFFLQQLGLLHADRLGVFYYDPSTTLTAMPQGMSGLPPGCLNQLNAMSDVKMLGEVRAEGNYMAVNMRMRYPTGEGVPPAPSNKRSPLLDVMPANTVAYFEARQVGRVLQTTISQVLGCMDTGQTPMNLTQIEQALGVSFESYFDFIDDTGVALTYGDGKWGGGLVATVDDEAVAKTRLERLLSFLRMMLGTGGGQGGPTLEEVAHGEVTITTIRIPAAPALPAVPTGPADPSSFGIAVANGRLYMGTDDFVANALDRAASDSLSSSARLESALASAGQENAGIVYVDLAALRGAVESMIPAAQQVNYELEGKPFVEPLDQLIVVTRTDGSILSTHAFLYVE
ncbi:MAG TPA: DUF3352 domain-containing protein [Candidatus Limnocylindrales bacterium]|nr:DUF3352 domain-containing protein [Candidatus Limnocylindrales bacterium]